MRVSASNLQQERRNDKNEKKNFYNKNSNIHCYQFITPNLTGNSNKKMTLNLHRLNVKPN